jgi:hypothetical protein
MSKTIKGRLKNLDKYIQSKWEEHYWNFLMKYEDKLNWYNISQNLNITMEMIEKYPNKDWDWNGISRNPNLTMEMIENSPEKPWDWYCLSQHPNITMEMIDKYPDKPWSWYNLSNNQNITIEMIENNPNKDWDWNGILYNPNLTMEIIEKYPNQDWYWNGISYNKFTKEKELFYQKHYRIYMATFRLQQYFNRMYDNPNYLFCRTRLEKLFS